MEISKKTDYAVRMLAMLAKDPQGTVSVRAAAEENGIPYSFARAIQHDLTRMGLVESVRGARGGMRLAMDLRQKTLLDIIEAIQGPISLASCEYFERDGKPCPRKPECRFNPVWCGAEQLLRSYFSAATLNDVVAKGMTPAIDGPAHLVQLAK